MKKASSPPLSSSAPFQAERVGLPKQYLGDLYHFLLTTSWPKLLFSIFVVYVVSNMGFAFLYMLDPHAIEGTHSRSYIDLFFFSVQTMATIGYGKMVPQSIFANLLVTLEALVGLLGFAFATGLMFAKFSRPTARVLFSRHVVVSNRDNIPSLMVRMANERGNQIVEAQLRLVLVQSETTAEGESVRRFYELPLLRDRNTIFALTWTALHPISKDSPLYQATPQSLAEKNATLVVSLVGIDETFSQTVHARHSYPAKDILWGYRFVDILSRLQNGRIRVDYTKFHSTQPAPFPANPS